MVRHRRGRACASRVAGADRELFYTAVTRARGSLILAGIEEAVRAAVAAGGGAGFRPAPAAVGERGPLVDPVRSSRLAAAAYLAGVRDPRVLAAAAEVPRAAYVPRERASEAKRDRAIRIGGGQFTSQRSLIAVMLEALGPRGEERVLEVGAGLGYQTALLARLAREVWSVEWIPELAAGAAANLAQGVQNATVVVGDGSEGLPDSAPFDPIVVAAAHPRVPPPLAAQLAPGGRLVQPVGPSGHEDVTLFRRTAEGVLVRVCSSLLPARLVPLCGRHGFGGGPE